MALPIRKRIQYVIIWTLRALTIVALGLAIYSKDAPSIINGIAASMFVFLPELIERKYKIKLLPEFSFFIVAFMYASIVLGGISHYYNKFWWWDSLLHLGSGVMLGVAGFLIIFILYETKQFSSSALLVSFLVVCFALALGTLWEVFEFALDQTLKTTLQPDLFDTMKDLINDSIGAVIVAVFGYWYIRFQKGWFFARVVETFLEKNPHLKDRPKFVIKK